MAMVSLLEKLVARGELSPGPEQMTNHGLEWTAHKDSYPVSIILVLQCGGITGPSYGAIKNSRRCQQLLQHLPSINHCEWGQTYLPQCLFFNNLTINILNALEIITA